MRKISVIIPIIRKEASERCISSINKNAGVDKGQYEIVAGFDTRGEGCPKMVKSLADKAKYDLVMFLGDDTEPEKDFMKNALKAMDSLPDGWGVVGLNTQDIRIGTGNQVAHWLADRRILEHIPGGDFFSTEYKHCWCDNELQDIALDLGRWVWAEDARIKHNHPINQSAKDDEGYQKAYSEKNKIHDYKTYCLRKRARMKEKYGVKLAIAVPLTDATVYAQFFFSFIKVITEYMTSLFHQGKSVGVDVLMPDFPAQIDAARNNLVHQALVSGCTHILMMDSDQIYETPDMINKLLDHNKPVVGARVHRRYPPFDPLLLRGEVDAMYQVPDEEVQNEDGSFEKEVPVDFTGTGCILYNMEIFTDTIDETWFKLRKGGRGQAVGEDISFCERLGELKIPIVVDSSINIRHLSLLAVDWGTYKLFQKIMGGKENGTRK